MKGKGVSTAKIKAWVGWIESIAGIAILAFPEHRDALSDLAFFLQLVRNSISLWEKLNEWRRLRRD